MTKRRPRVITIILTWNSADFICDAIESVQASSYPTKLLIVDNDSSDNTRELIAQTYPDVAVHNTGANLGYAGGNNAGIQLALQDNPDYIFILNPDATVAKDCVEKLVSRLEADKELAAISPIIYHAESNHIWYAGSSIHWLTGETPQDGQGQIDTGQFANVTCTGRLNGCAMLVRTKIFESVGLLDDRFFLYYEETDWSARCIRAGYKLGFESQAHVRHLASASTGGNSNPLYRYYTTRNKLLLILKNRPAMLLPVTLHSVAVSCMFVARAVRSDGVSRAMAGAKAICKGYRDFALRRFGLRHK